VSPSDSDPAREFTVESADYPTDPRSVFLEQTRAERQPEELAGALMTVVEQCGEISYSASQTQVRITEDQVTIVFPSKNLRTIILEEGTDPVTWTELQTHLVELPANTEWLVLTSRPLTGRVKAEITDCDYRRELHYISISRTLYWAEDES
jgi:hypothetical protein